VDQLKKGELWESARDWSRIFPGLSMPELKDTSLLASGDEAVRALAGRGSVTELKQQIKLRRVQLRRLGNVAEHSRLAATAQNSKRFGTSPQAKAIARTQQHHVRVSIKWRWFAGRLAKLTAIVWSYWACTTGSAADTWRSINDCSQRSIWKKVATFEPATTLLKIGTYLIRSCVTLASTANTRLVKLRA